MEHTDHPFPAPAGYDRLVQTIRRRLPGAPLLIAIDGRKLTFEVSAADSKGTIGKGTHERFIIDNEKFMAKVNK